MRALLVGGQAAERADTQAAGADTKPRDESSRPAGIGGVPQQPTPHLSRSTAAQPWRRRDQNHAQNAPVDRENSGVSLNSHARPERHPLCLGKDNLSGGAGVWPARGGSAPTPLIFLLAPPC